MKITTSDFDLGRKVIRNELLKEVNEKSISECIIYCILSASENYEKQLRVYNNLKNRDLLNPQNIVNNYNLMKNIVREARFPNQKERRIYQFSEWFLSEYLNKGLILKLIKDANNGKDDGFNLRNDLAKNCFGISYKCASLVLNKCGYDYVVPIDIWVIRYLRELGYDIAEPDYETESGLTGRKYIKMEEEIVKIAKEYGVSPNLLQATIWSKNAKFEKVAYQRNLNDFKW